MAILLIAAFLMTAAATLGLGTRFDFDNPLKSRLTGPRQRKRVPPNSRRSLPHGCAGFQDPPVPECSAIHCRKLQADKTNISQVFIPGLGAFMIASAFYLPADDAPGWNARNVEALFRLLPPHQNLPGFQPQNEVAEAVQNRSPQGLTCSCKCRHPQKAGVEQNRCYWISLRRRAAD
jgi:hypothetical protein